MRLATLLISCVVLGFAGFVGAEPATRPAAATSIHDFTVDDINGKPVDLSIYKGKVVLLLNVASKCGNTKQYAGLEQVYQQYKDQGLAILAFPANDFGGQEPGTNAQIAEFCSGKYNVTFDLFSKISVKGEKKAPLYQYLTSKETNPKFGGEITWNFGKFLIARDGTIVARFDPKTKPEDPKVISEIEKHLK